MYYVTLDGQTLYDPRAKEYVISNPKLSLEVNKTGSFTFTIYQSHPLYSSIAKLKSIIEVYQDNVLRFRGRVLDDETALNNAKTVTCEGELAYFNDTILRPYEFTGSVTGYLALIIDQHNAQVTDDKQFKLGNVTVVDPNDVIVRSDSTYPKTWDVIEDKLIKSLGGYLMIRRENGVNYLDYLADSNFKSDQTIELGKNLLDLSRTSSAIDIYTAILPLGTPLKDEDGEDTGEKLTIKSVNGDSDVLIDADAVLKYGYIVKVVEWSDVTLADNLLRKAKAELAELVKMSITLELTAVDLKNAGHDVNHFRLFEYVQVTSKPHEVDEMLLVEKLELNLTNPATDKLTIGLQRKSLTDNQVSTNKVIEKVTANYVVNEQVREIQKNTTEKFSAINQKADSIITIVGEESDLNYASLADYTEFKQTTSTQFEQTKDSFSFEFNKILEQITNIDDETKTQFSEIVKYIRFEDGNIILGQVGNEFILKIANDRISFLQARNEVAYISNNKLYITDGEFLTSLRIGNFAFVPRQNGNLSFKWLGGESSGT